MTTKSKAQLDREIAAMMATDGYTISLHRAGNYTGHFSVKSDAIKAAQALANETLESVDVVKIEKRGEDRHVVDEIQPERTKAGMAMKDRLFKGIIGGTGVSYADRGIEKNGDYKKLAHLSFATLELTWYAKKIPPMLRAEIERDAARIQARRGEDYPTSGSGQTVELGYKLRQIEEDKARAARIAARKG